MIEIRNDIVRGRVALSLMVVSLAEVVGGFAAAPATAAESWPVIAGEGTFDGGLYMVSGDATPEGANAWFEPQSGALTRQDGSRVENYLKATYGIEYRPINPNLIFKTPPVGWMTWYAVKFQAGDSVVLHNARDFLAKFRGYTDEQPVLWVDWEWFHPRFKDDGVASDTDMLSPRKDVYPRGMKVLADDLKALGFTPALWVSVFSDVRTNALWRAHPEWVLGYEMNWCGALGGNPSAPGFCEEYVPEIFSLYRGWGFEAFKWDTVPVAYKRFKKWREQGLPVGEARETLRKCAKAVRRAVGENCYVMSCSGELDEVNLAAIDIFDGGRIGGDIFSWKDFRKWGVDRILSYQPFHNTVFWSDADNLVLRSEFSTEAQARTRVSIYALAGVPITLGDEIMALDERRIDMLRRAMPVVMLRPASLKRGGPATDLLPLRVDFARPFGTWQVRGWSNLTTDRTLSATLKVRDAAVWDYWNDRLVAAGRGERQLGFEIAPGDTTVCRVTPLASVGPTLLSVSRHLTQGGYELKSYAADAQGATGVVRCPGGETVTVTFLLPEGAAVQSATHPCDCDGQILRLRLTSDGCADVPFNLKLAATDSALAPADDAAGEKRQEVAVPTAPAKYRRPPNWKPSAPYPKSLREIARDHSAATMARAKAQMEKVNAVNRAGKYHANGRSMDRHRCPEWFLDAKLGMFIDWGLYSIAAYSPYLKGARLYPDWYEYKSRPEYHGKDSAWEYHRKNWGEDFKPDHFIALFKGEKFDAAKMMKVFRECGAKYVVPFLKHHSGFCLWDSSYTFRDTVDGPAKRDFTREMADAARAEGLKFGVYNSQADEWEYPILRPDGSVKMKLWGGKLVDCSPEMETKASGKIAVRDFVYDYIVPQMTEFVDKYDPDIMWYDADWMTLASENGSFDITAYFYNRAEGRKEVCCNDRYGKLDPAEEAAIKRAGLKYCASRTVRGDFFTDEWGDTAENLDPAKWYPWESCSGISKAYGNHWMEELDPSMVMSDREFIAYFADIVARGGNLLLLVNLDGQGAIPKVQEDRMLSIGKWLAKNGEAIYATRIVAPFSTPKVDYTRSKDGKKIYAIVKEPAAAVTLECALPAGAKIRVLGSATPLAYAREGKNAKVTIPAALVNSPLPFVLVCGGAE